MDLEPVAVERDPDHVEAAGPDLSTQPGRLLPLGGVGRIDRITSPTAGPHFDSHPARPVTGQDVDLASSDPDVGGDDGDAPFDQVPAGQRLPETPDLAPIQRERPDCSSSSMLTSR